MLADRYGLEVSTSSQSARDAYVVAADCILAGVAGWREALALALDSDSKFALAHAARARGLFLDSEVALARQAAAKARELARAATRREQGHVNALALAIEGKVADSLEATRQHLAEFARDAMVLAPLTGVFGLIGFSGRPLREAELDQQLQQLQPQYGDDWWFLSVLAFAACECGRLDQAHSLIERSLATNPRNAHGAHVKAHVLYEMGGTEECFEYLEAWMPGLAKSSLLHCHLSWHLALTALALGQSARAWDAYRTSVHPGGAWGPPLNVVTDSASFLWRAELAGDARHSDLWREVQIHALRCFPRAGVPFADLHVALSCIASGESAALEKLAGDVRARLEAGKLAPGKVLPTLIDGFAAYANNDWGAAVHLFEQAQPETVRIGGSRAQRDLVENTLLAAYLKAGRIDQARDLISKRGERRPTTEVAGLANE